jgi:hypothetical protein
MSELMLKKRVSLAGVLVLLALLSTACGGDRPLSKEQYVSKLDAACSDFAAREKKIGGQNSLDDLVQKGPRILEAFDQTILKRARDLNAPDEIADQADLMTKFAEQQHDVLRGLFDAAKANDFAKVTELASKNAAINKKASAVARDLGAKTCAGE